MGPALPYTDREIEVSRRVLADEVEEWGLGDRSYSPDLFGLIARDAGVSVSRMRFEASLGDRGNTYPIARRLKEQVLRASRAQVARYMDYRDRVVHRMNPAASAVVGLVAAAAALAVGTYLVVRGAQGSSDQSVPAPPPLPNYYKGPNGEIITTAGPYGVPPDVQEV